MNSIVDAKPVVGEVIKQIGSVQAIDLQGNVRELQQGSKVYTGTRLFLLNLESSAPLFSSGKEVTITISSVEPTGGETITGTINIDGSEVKVFSIVLDGSTGEYFYKQFQPFDYPDQGPDSLLLNIQYRITDGDHDYDENVLTIRVIDDVTGESGFSSEDAVLSEALIPGNEALDLPQETDKSEVFNQVMKALAYPTLDQVNSNDILSMRFEYSAIDVDGDVTNTNGNGFKVDISDDGVLLDPINGGTVSFIDLDSRPEEVEQPIAVLSVHDLLDQIDDLVDQLDALFTHHTPTGYADHIDSDPLETFALEDVLSDDNIIDDTGIQNAPSSEVEAVLNQLEIMGAALA